MADQRDLTKQLGAWFLGPKAENANLTEEMILYILRDYFHWRRNYFPSDEITITQQMRRESLDWSDSLFQQLGEMLARLKRHFPFYSPRYVAHMLSDQTLPSVLGYFAGMLYNPNNVTPEAAPVTVEWELEVAADILRMLGYAPPPPVGAHHRETRKEFGWAHISSGGTVANIEALWVARNIRYFPLAARRVCQTEGIDLAVKLPGQAEAVSLASLEDRQCLSIRPNEAIFLLPRLIEALRQQRELPDADAVNTVWRLLAQTGINIAGHGVLHSFHAWPPAVFVSGTAHYSVVKACDLLGIGKDNVILVDVDRQFRLDLRDLESKVTSALDQGMFPLAVIAIGGTTEEGSVDPVHEIVDFRRRLETGRGLSFWLHIDSAWAGYLRTLFVTRDHGANPSESDFPARIAEINQFASRRLLIRRGLYERSVDLRWGSREVCSAYLSFPKAESITIDPHKMGYVPYPCGVVAFRNDRIRHFLTQEAPYITVTTPEDVQSKVYHPPSNVGPFILEGSKPGAAAASLWLSHRTIAPSREGYGEIMRASLLAARELYERLVHWEQSCRANHEETGYRFIPITAPPPDTNMVCFVVKAKDSNSLPRMNRLSEAVYKRFTIQAELGERDYSYSQPFFLSRTRFHLPQYSAHSVEDLLARAGVDATEYPAHGIFVIRATVMNPYILLSSETGHRQEFLADLVERLAAETGRCLAEIG
ncbi:MAG: pyridoxal phosphate-dependent decarboxylase family protein [Bryobacteraceae bacterium]